MMMIQSVIAACVERDPRISPAEVICVVNAVMFENVRQRLHQDEHATLTVLRFNRDGDVSFAGAHEDILLLRSATGSVEILQTPGTWVGAVRDVSGGTISGQLHLDPGDLICLYTDGVTEARDASGALFGVPRLAEELKRVAHEPVERVRDHLVQALHAHMAEQTDDFTIVVARRT